MKRDLFRRYVWLVDTIRHGNRPTFEEIADAWEHAPLNDDMSPLALRTFHNHRDAIEHLFGIRILCNRSDHNRYYIADEGEKNATHLKVWMLQTLSLSNTIHRSSSVEKRILLDITPEEKFCLLTLIDAMKRDKCVEVEYSLPDASGKTAFRVEPYCVRFWNSCWYVFGRDVDTEKLSAFNIARILTCRISDRRFRFPMDFDPQTYFANFFGMEIEDSVPVESIRLKISGQSRDEIRTLPMHPSQKEVLAGKDFSIFSFSFAPTRDFKSKVLSMGTECEVVAPAHLREEIKEMIRGMMQPYLVEHALTASQS